MIYDSSIDPNTGVVLMAYDGHQPSQQDIVDHCQRHHGFVPGSFFIHPGSRGYSGFFHPGTVRCHPSKDYFSNSLQSF